MFNVYLMTQTNYTLKFASHQNDMNCTLYQMWTSDLKIIMAGQAFSFPVCWWSSPPGHKTSVGFTFTMEVLYSKWDAAASNIQMSRNIYTYLFSPRWVLHSPLPLTWMWEVRTAGIYLVLRSHVTFHEMLTNVFLLHTGQQWHESNQV